MFDLNMNLRLRNILLTASCSFVAVSCGTGFIAPSGVAASPDSSAQENPTCGNERIETPVNCPPMHDGAGDGYYLAVCAVDCLGNVYPVEHNGLLTVRPGLRYAAYFQPYPNKPPPLPLNVRGSIGRPTGIEDGTGSGLHDAPSDPVETSARFDSNGGFLVTIDEGIEGPMYFQVEFDIMFPIGHGLLAFVPELKR